VADAEDATQETLWVLVLTRHVGAIRAFGFLSAWLFSVARRECLRLARRTGLVATVDEEALDARLVHRPEAELRRDLAAAFGALPPHYREVAMLRDIQELAIDEIAAKLGLSRQATKARPHRASLLLREYLIG